jgi:hypothetical protein
MRLWLRVSLRVAAGIAEGLNVVKVAVADVRVEHEVRLKDLTAWLDRVGRLTARDVGPAEDSIASHLIR